MSAKKQYTVAERKHGWPKFVTRGPAKGYTLAQTLTFVAECLAEPNTRVGTIKFNNRNVKRAHREKIIGVAKLWAEIQAMEKALQPFDALRQ
jgi:hypothetical protein